MEGVDDLLVRFWQEEDTAAEALGNMGAQRLGPDRFLRRFYAIHRKGIGAATSILRRLI